MAEHELEKLLGGFAADTLTPEERRQLFTAAMQDQQLFNALADEQALKELLTDPAVRRCLLQALHNTTPVPARRPDSWLDWLRRPANLALAGGLAAAVFAVVLGTRIYQDSVQQATRERTAATPPRATVPADTLRDYAPKNTQPEADLKQAATPAVSMGKASEEVAVRTEHLRAAGSPPAAAMPEAKTARAPAGASLPEISSSTVSARGLFYGVGAETGRTVQAQERTPKPLAESAPQADQFQRKLEGLSQLGKAADPVTPVKPLALRYSFVIRNAPGQEQEIDRASAEKSAAPVQLTIETNQDGYIQIWKNVGSANTQLLLPQKDSGHISLKMQAGQRQRLPLPADSGTVIVRLSRIPFGPISRQEAALLNRIAPNQLRESVTASSPTGLQEQAIYVASQDPSPTAQITVDILPAHRQ